MERTYYVLTIGSIIYMILYIRPYVFYALIITSKYKSNPGEGHQKIVKNILNYLRRMKNIFFIYKG